ncbi:MAG: tRNA (adenosine(37)-N6)-dimethylallyltransferase MiaA [Gammaproteobacteria bacterium]|nr:tRNA (adenosine(37)-N6)-dimethylallyltransferase MiaA [Gammaproteobacteria bacterium]
MTEDTDLTRLPVVMLMGPTGAGKSAMALALAQEFGGEIVNVDSAQVYRGMDIGTAKASPAERRTVPHHLLDLCDPAEVYSAARFRADALVTISEIRARGRIPLLVGGTGLYFRALLQGLSDLPAADPVIRSGLRTELERSGSQTLHARLARLDPRAAARIHPNDPQRILRALEVHAQTGQPMSTLLERTSDTVLPFPVVIWVLAPATREALHARLARRFLSMLERGFVNEVMALWSRGDLSPDMPALRAVGYRAVWRYLEGRVTHAAMVDEAIVATRQLAKRQFTWFRSMSDTTWWDSADMAVGQRLRQAFAKLL